MPAIRFTTSKPGGDRRHYLDEQDVRIVLQRLPAELYSSLRAVHFNDRGGGARRAGYVTRGHREIALCALPPRVSLAGFLRGKQSPRHFGAERGRQWPATAIRRCLLYHVFLHELGHLQLVDEQTKSRRLRFARERLAQEFADFWREKLWADWYEHPDPAHNRPLAAEFHREPVSAD
jgi:hypothetical protein